MGKDPLPLHWHRSFTAADIKRDYIRRRISSASTNEFRINNRPISNEKVVASYNAVKDAHFGKRDPTFFEFTTAMALFEFAAQKVDWAVIETGMGGRLDATNIINPELSIITNISLEHREYLGNTLAQIAAEKAGNYQKTHTGGHRHSAKKSPC